MARLPLPRSRRRNGKTSTACGASSTEDIPPPGVMSIHSGNGIPLIKGLLSKKCNRKKTTTPSKRKAQISCPLRLQVTAGLTYSSSSSCKPASSVSLWPSEAAVVALLFVVDHPSSSWWCPPLQTCKSCRVKMAKYCPVGSEAMPRTLVVCRTLSPCRTASRCGQPTVKPGIASSRCGHREEAGFIMVSIIG